MSRKLKAAVLCSALMSCVTGCATPPPTASSLCQIPLYRFSDPAITAMSYADLQWLNTFVTVRLKDCP